jgi:hypothetical protein
LIVEIIIMATSKRRYIAASTQPVSPIAFMVLVVVVGSSKAKRRRTGTTEIDEHSLTPVVT